MKWIQIILLSIFISLPSLGNSAVAFSSSTVIGEQVETVQKKKEKPRKKIRKWIRNHQGAMIFGGLFLAGLTMLILGIIHGVKWLWIMGLLTIITPWFLAILIVILYLVFGTKQRPLPVAPPDTPIQEKEKTKK